MIERSDGTTDVLRAEDDALAYGLTAMVLGGGTRVWQGMSWRFWEQDFRMASTYGTPAGSTLADWPFDYSELEPYYERAEWELGVAGDADSAVGRATPRRRGYPMPAMRADRTRDALTSAATRLGLSASPIPFAINSVPRNGRAACVHCAQCIGHACPVDAKNGAQNTFIPRALATGRADLLLGAQVTSIAHDGGGRHPESSAWWKTATVNARSRCAPIASWSPQAPSRQPDCCWPRGSATTGWAAIT